MPLFTRLLRAGETKMVKRLGKIAAHIDTLEPEVQKLTDAELRAKTDEFRGTVDLISRSGQDSLAAPGAVHRCPARPG